MMTKNRQSSNLLKATHNKKAWGYFSLVYLYIIYFIFNPLVKILPIKYRIFKICIIIIIL